MTDNAAFWEGIEQAKQGDQAAAIACFDQAIAADPHWSEAYYRRGLAYFDMGRLQQAAFDYSRAIELANDYQPALYGRALVRVVLDHFDGALDDLASLLQLNPQNPAAHQLKATALRKRGDLAAAIVSLRKATELYLDRRDPVGARQCLDLLKQLQPNASPPVLTEPLPPFNAPPTLASLQTTATGTSSTGASSTGTSNTGTPNAGTPVGAMMRPEAFYAQALNRAESGDVQGAIAELDWALKLDPQDPKALACRAAVRIKQGNWQGAIADCNRAIQGGGADATLYRYRARARLEMGDRAGALTDLDQALAQDDQNPLLWLARGDAQQALGNYSAAIGDYNQALELGGDRPAILLLRAQAAVRQENLKQAIEDYQTAASLFCDRNDWERYRATLEQLKMLQQPVNLSPGLPQKSQNPLWQRLLGRVGGQEAIAQTLLDRARDHYPNMDEDWYLEKVLYDLERDDLPED